MIFILDKKGQGVMTGDRCFFTTIVGEKLEGVLGYSSEKSEFGFDVINSTVDFICILEVNKESIEKIVC